MSNSADVERWTRVTATQDGEGYLLEQYLTGESEGADWFNSVKAGMESSLLERPLVQQLIKMSEEPLLPVVDNFTPPQRTPWGGYDILRKYKSALGVGTTEIVGESWEVSGHPSFPNRFTLSYNEQSHCIPIDVLEELAPQRLYGSECLATQHKMPLLVKMLNSGSWYPYRNEMLSLFEATAALEVPAHWKEALGLKDLRQLTNLNNHDLHSALSLFEMLLESDSCPESFKPLLPPIARIHQEMLTKNLSVQVHPSSGDFDDMPSKTEAWTILHAEKGSGIYLGIKEEVSKEQFAEAMVAGNDLSQMLNFVEVEEGDVFFIPAGTLHAIGAGILLVEVQETSESTFRAYDWGRMQDGKPRPLHHEETMQVTAWDAPRGMALVDKLKREPEAQVQMEGTCLVESFIDEKPFQQSRLTFQNAEQEYLGDTTPTGIQAFTIVSGEVTLHTDKPGATTLQAGHSFIIPAAVGSYRLSTAVDNTQVLQFTAINKDF